MRVRTAVSGTTMSRQCCFTCVGRVLVAEAGKERCAELLLSHGLRLEDTDINGQTPLYYACSENQLGIVRAYATRGSHNGRQNASTTSTS